MNPRNGYPFPIGGKTMAEADALIAKLDTDWTAAFNGISAICRALEYEQFWKEKRESDLMSLLKASNEDRDSARREAAELRFKMKEMELDFAAKVKPKRRNGARA